MKKLIFLLVAFCTIHVHAQEVLLRYNSKEGDTYKMEMKVKQEVGTFMAQTTETTMIMKTISVTDTTIVNEMKIDKMSMDMIQGQNIINYDSTKSDEELDETGKMMKAQLAPVLSAVITTTQDKLGNVKGVSVDPNIPQAAQMTNQSSNTVFPEEAVTIGSTWSDTREENGMNIKTNYTVSSIDANYIDLDITGDVTGMGNGKLSGKMKLTISSGIPVNSSMQMDLNIQGMDSKMSVEVSFTKS